MRGSEDVADGAAVVAIPRRAARDVTCRVNDAISEFRGGESGIITWHKHPLNQQSKVSGHAGMFVSGVLSLNFRRCALAQHASSSLII